MQCAGTGARDGFCEKGKKAEKRPLLLTGTTTKGGLFSNITAVSTTDVQNVSRIDSKSLLARKLVKSSSKRHEPEQRTCESRDTK
jgi:hypothetical protein